MSACTHGLCLAAQPPTVALGIAFGTTGARRVGAAFNLTPFAAQPDPLHHPFTFRVWYLTARCFYL
jgi:hypothetical protein